MNYWHLKFAEATYYFVGQRENFVKGTLWKFLAVTFTNLARILLMNFFMVSVVEYYTNRTIALKVKFSGQTSKVKGLQTTYMAALFGTFGTKSLVFWQEFGFIENRNPNSCQEAKHVSIKYSKSHKKILIIYFNGLHLSLLRRSLSNGLLVWAA